MSIRWFYFLFLFSAFASCVEFEDSDALQQEEEPYQLIIQYDGEANYYMRRNLIDYFKSIALGSEYGTSFRITSKWHTPMKLFIGGSPSEEHILELERIIAEINSLVSDGFYIEVVNNQYNSNFYAYFGDGLGYSSLFPKSSEYVKDHFGLFTTEYNEDFKIYSGHLFVDTERASKLDQFHALREELTQSLGLANDILYYPNSIFYASPSRVTEYSDLDKEVIRLLYHPKMKAGLGEESVQNILEGILGI